MKLGHVTYAVLFGALALTGCSSSGSSSGTGELAVKLTDAPGPYDQVNVNVVEIAAHRAGDNGPGDGGWVTLAVPRTSVDLLTLQNGVELPLGAGSLPAGSYDMLRLVVDDPNVVIAGAVLPLKVPSGSTRGVQIQHAFTVVEDGHTELLIDFDAQASIHQEGNGGYIMSPVLSVKRDTH